MGVGIGEGAVVEVQCREWTIAAVVMVRICLKSIEQALPA
jgi:hypothetical protein